MNDTVKIKQKLINDFWKKKLIQLEDNSHFAFHSSNQPTYDRIEIQLEEKHKTRIESLASDNKSGILALYITFYKVLLFKYFHNPHLFTGSYSTNLHANSLSNQKELLFEAVIEPAETLKDLLKKVSREIQQNLNFSDYDDDIENLFDHYASKLPAFFCYYSNEDVEPTRRGMVNLEIELKDNQTNIYLKYDNAIYDQSFMEQFGRHFCNVVDHIHHMDVTIADLDILSLADKKHLFSFNRSANLFPENHSFQQLWSTQVKQIPDAIALNFQHDHLTYGQIDEESSKLANYLLSNGIQKNPLIMIAMDRGPQVIISMLAILKAGGAFIPVDVNYPIERINHMVEDSRAEWVLTQENVASLFVKSDTAKLIVTDALKSEIDKCSPLAPDIISKPDDLAYVIYTSGSTGIPKGVLIKHRGFLNMIYALIDCYQLKAGTRVLQFASFSFDASCAEIFPTLFSAGCLVLPEREDLLDKNIMGTYAEKHRIDVAAIPPSYQVLIDKKPVIHTLISAGDALNTSQAKKLQEFGIRLINGYGPTENTVCVSNSDTPILNSRINIGPPTPNVQVYIINKNDQLVPIGSEGELCIAGSQLARGYLNRPEMTAEKFQQVNVGNKVLNIYRTGDRAKWDRMGNLEHLGRIDQQVKIRGFRIEIGEIESVIQQSALVSQNAVVVAENDLGKKIVAFVVTKDEVIKEELLTHCKKKLPDFMIPASIRVIKELPLTPNSKVDRGALRKQALLEEASNYLAPSTTVEQDIAEVWAQLFTQHAGEIGINDNFFELGGDSIINIQAVHRLQVKGYNFKSADIFEHQTIAELADLVSRQETDKVITEQGILSGEFNLSPIQQWFFENESWNLDHFNQSVLLTIGKEIKESDLQELFSNLYAHHDALRLSFVKHENKWRQCYSEKNLNLSVEKLEDSTDKKHLNKRIEKICTLYQQSLNIRDGKLKEVVFIKTPSDEPTNRLLIVVHHLVVDGVSWRVMLHQLETGLNKIKTGEKLEWGNKSSSYRQWVQALDRHVESQKVMEQLDHWQGVVKGYQTLPVDKETGANILKDQKHHSVELDEEFTRLLLENSSKAYQTDINGVLLTALALTISRWSGNSKILIGVEGHGREDIFSELDLTRTIGWFTNLYPVLLSVDETYAIEEMVQFTDEQLSTVPDKGLGFGLLKYLHPSEKIRSSLDGFYWDIEFNHFGNVDNTLQPQSILQAAEESYGQAMSEDFPIRGKIAINSHISSGELQVSWSYSSSQYFQETIELLASQYIQNLREIISYGKTLTPVERPSPDTGLLPDVSKADLTKLINSLEAADRLEPKKISSIYKLSPIQEGLLFHSLYDINSPSYIIQSIYRLPESFNISAFEAAWNHLIKRHSILRTAFFYNELSIPVQAVYEQVKIHVEVKDFSDLPEREFQNRLDLFLNEDKHRGFDFKVAPLMRLTLVHNPVNGYTVIWTFHHIILDGWSLPVLMREFIEVYDCYLRNEQPELGKSDNFEDYLKYLSGKDKEAGEHFWKGYLSEIENPTILPFIKKSNEFESRSDETKDWAVSLTPHRTNEIRQLAQQNHVTINTIIQAAWSFLVAKYTNQTEGIFGVTVSGRPSNLPNVEQRIGMYMNTIPLRFSLKADMSLCDWLTSIQKEHSQAREYEFVGLTDIQGYLNISSSLFDNILIFENYPTGNLDEETSSLNVEDFNSREQTNYPLTLVAAISDRLMMRFSYYDSISEDTVKMVAEHMEHVLAQMIDHPDATLSELTLLTKEEQKRLVDFNNTEKANDESLSVVDLFHKRASESYSAIALSDSTLALTYGELDAKSNAVAHFLKQRGVSKQDLVGICVHPSVEMIVVILGILKVGAVYVPIDSEYPNERITYIIEDTNMGLLIVDNTTYDIASNDRSVDLTLIEELIASLEDNLKTCNDISGPDDLAYVIYTSGSTGNPKGVLVEHKSLTNYLTWANETYVRGLSYESPLFTSTSFDLTVTSIFLPLITGNAIRVFKERKEDLLLSEIINNSAFGVIKFTPAHLRLYLAEGVEPSSSSDKRFILGGEQLETEMAERLYSLFGPSCEIYNEYGPTEATVGSMIYKYDSSIDVSGNVPIGQPITNAKIYVMDRFLHDAAEGIPGEIYIGGIPVARGYLNSPDSTHEQFLKLDRDKGLRLYKTGDLAKRLADGNLEYLGRTDEQIKIRGYRVEPGEIQNVLLETGKVMEAVVLTKGDSSENQRLIAYVIPTKEYDADVVLTYLKRKLPEYMVPSFLIELEEIPLTEHGKVDRKFLQQMELKSLQKYVPARNDIEEQLVQIWQDVLGIPEEQISIYASFFELGGHSLLATRMTAAILNNLNIQIAVRDIFSHPTIVELSHFLENHEVYHKNQRQLIDLDKESVLDIDLTHIHKLEHYSSEFKNVLITGATGFVGVYVLSELLKNSDATIYCLARAKDNNEARTRIVNQLKYFNLYDAAHDHRILPITGDISQPNLGIESSDYYKILDEVDAIYHVAVEMNFSGTYDKLKAANVGSNKEIIRMAASRKLKKIIYVSTLDVFSGFNGKKRNEYDDIDNELHEVSQGYAGSKWVGEKLLLKAMNAGVPVQIHRLGLTTGDISSGKSPREQWFSKLLKTCHDLGIYTDEYFIPATPVDFAAKSLTRLSFLEKYKASVFHITNPDRVPLSAFVESDLSSGKEMKKCLINEFLQVLKSESIDTDLPINSLMDTSTDWSEDSSNGIDVFWHCELTLSILEEEFDITFPNMSTGYGKYLQGAIEVFR